MGGSRQAGNVYFCCMAAFSFVKYHGTGNDFILIDDREGRFPTEAYSGIEQLCHRRFGIGADGLILVQHSGVAHFKMVYFNSDGRPSTFCGNGSRCIASYAHSLGLGEENFIAFEASDGLHQAEILPNDVVVIKMGDVGEVTKTSMGLYLHTGSPHLVVPVEEILDYPVKEIGRSYRNDAKFRPGGTNVNFMQRWQDGVFARTYERGVEDETFSCGTGVVAAALVANLLYSMQQPIKIHTQGGVLSVSFQRVRQGFQSVYLIGPAKRVFDGVLEIV